MNSKQVSELFNLSVDTLRYYERIGVIPPVSRDKNGYRNYQTNDLNWIFLAKSLRAAGLSIESLIEFAALSMNSETEDVADAQKQILFDQLEEVNKNIEKMKKVRSLLQYKIETYDDHMGKFKSGELTKENVEKLWTMEHFKNSE